MALAGKIAISAGGSHTLIMLEGKAIFHFGRGCDLAPLKQSSDTSVEVQFRIRLCIDAEWSFWCQGAVEIDLPLEPGEILCEVATGLSHSCVLLKHGQRLRYIVLL